MMRKVLSSNIDFFMKKRRMSPLLEFVPKTWILLKNYSVDSFKHDLLSGITVGIVALPLAMAFAIASGVSPERGLYTAIIAGFLTSLLGGSRYQIAGPTGAFVVILYSIVQRHGYEGLVVVSLIAGVILLIAAAARIGSLIKYIPYPLVTGFTTGIAVVIASSQIKDFFGLSLSHLPADFLPKWKALFHALPSWDPITLIVSLSTLFVILLIRRFFPVLPWGIISVTLATLACSLLHLPIETIASRFGSIDQEIPLLSLSALSSCFHKWDTLIADAFAIAFLAGIESLLSAVVADGMSGSRHKPNCELMAQGVANITSVLCGGIPSTGAIARTAINVKTGARTPVSGMIHSITLLIILLFLSPLVSQIPLASLAAVLMMISWNMAELDRFCHLFKAPKGDIAVLLTSFFLTVLVDLTVAVELGMILAAFLFMKRVCHFSSVRPWSLIAQKERTEALATEPHHIFTEEIPSNIEVYEISGPFLFGIADSLKSVLSNLELPPKAFILRMDKVPAIDASGLQALQDFYDRCHREKTRLLLSGVHPSLLRSMRSYKLLTRIGKESIFTHFHEALSFAKDLPFNKKQ